MNVKMRLPKPQSRDPLAPVPGIELRPATRVDAPALAALLAAAFPDWDWSVDRALTRLLDAPDVACTWMALAGSELVGTASEQVEATESGSVGVVHWVAVAESQRGRGLGRALTAAVIDGLWQRGVASIRLDTQAHRPAAIAMYASFGFVPEITSPQDQQTWSPIMAAITRR